MACCCNGIAPVAILGVCGCCNLLLIILAKAALVFWFGLALVPTCDCCPIPTGPGAIVLAGCPI